MQAGLLRHPITFQRATPGEDAAHAPTNTWVTYLNTFAAVSPTGTNESQADGGVVGVQSLVLRARYDPDEPIYVRDRALFNGRVLEIEQVTNIDERNRELVIVCREQVE
jgi:SPP1 family predicted phage head-tail adaptor